MKYYSQYKQDYLIDFLFSKKQNGFFLDIGAHDGISFSNSYFFEKYRGWKGICIEPNPVVFEKLKINRNCVLENCCISSEEGNVVFRKVSGYAEMLSGILDFFDDEHIERINQEISLYGGSYQDISVKSKKLNQILGKNQVYNIDYCSIDTEGAELEIIKSLDFEKYNIVAFSIEGSNAEVTLYLKNKGYKCVMSMCDSFYVKRDHNNFSVFYLMMKSYILTTKTKNLRLFKWLKNKFS